MADGRSILDLTERPLVTGHAREPRVGLAIAIGTSPGATTEATVEMAKQETRDERGAVIAPPTGAAESISEAEPVRAPVPSPGDDGVPVAPSAPAGVGPPGGFLRQTFASLQSRPFRFLWLSSMVSMGGFQMQMFARTIFVDELTGSAFITGLVGLGFAPSMLVLSLFGGVAGDKLERRMLIQITQVCSVVVALVIATLIVTGLIHWVHMLIASVIQGAFFAFQMPARQAIIPMLVGKEHITNAVALGAGGMSMTAIVVPGLAGLIYGKFGPGAVYFAMAGTYIVAVILVSRIPRFPPEVVAGSRKVWQDIGAGLKYVGSNRVVLLLLGSSLTVALLSMPFRLQLPVFARRLYGVEETLASGGTGYMFDASQVGWLLTFTGIGGVIGTLAVANLRKGHSRGFVLLVGSIFSGIAMALLGMFPFYVAGLAVMVLVGLAEAIRMTLGQALTIESTASEYRARVMSLSMMTFGLMPLGALPLGKAIDVYGAQAAVIGAAVIVMLAAVLFLIGARTLRRLS